MAATCSTCPFGKSTIVTGAKVAVGMSAGATLADEAMMVRAEAIGTCTPVVSVSSSAQATAIAGLTMTITPQITTYFCIGQVINFDLTITSRLNFPVIGVITPALGSGLFSSLACTLGSLVIPAGSTTNPTVTTCTLQHTVTTSEAALGETVTVSATGRFTSILPLYLNTLTASGTATYSPIAGSLVITPPTISGTFFPGQTIALPFTYRNNSNYPITVTSSAANTTPAGSATDVSCPAPFAIPAMDTGTCSVQHTISPTASAGITTTTLTLSGNAVAQGIAAGSPCAAVSATASTNIAVGNPALVVQKNAVISNPAGSSITAVGQRITYSYTVFNNSTSTITGITLTDPQLVLPDTFTAPAPFALPAGSSITFPNVTSPNVFGVHIVTLADLDLGGYVNAVNVQGILQGSTIKATGVNTTNANQFATLTLLKTVNPISYSTGTVLTYTFTVTNPTSSNVTVNNVTITDPLIPSITCASSSGPSCTSIAPGGTAQFRGIYTATQEDVNAGIIDNVASVDGRFGSGCADAFRATDIGPSPPESAGFKSRLAGSGSITTPTIITRPNRLAGLLGCKRVQASASRIVVGISRPLAQVYPVYQLDNVATRRVCSRHHHRCHQKKVK